MRRTASVLMTTVLLFFAMLWLFDSTETSTALAQGENDPNALPASIELEMLEMGGDLSDLPSLSDNVGVVSQLTNVYTMPNYATVSDRLPRVVVSKEDAELAEGYYFVSPFRTTAATAWDKGVMIVNDKAQLVYYSSHPLAYYYDFKRLPDGTASYFSTRPGGFNVIDNTYSISKTWILGNGYGEPDIHDFILLKNGNVAMMDYDYQPVDLTAYGGLPNAEVIDIVLQEITPDGEVVFQWNSRDYIAFTDTFASLTGAVVDYVHTNAIEEDYDGNFLISSRHLSEITKIDRNTGEIIWRLGGKNNEFEFIGDETLPEVGGFSYQHDIRRLPNGNITLFDNANQFIDAGIRGSRGVEYAIDEVNKTVTFVREFRSTPETYATFMGSMQRLPNENTIIGWGGGTPPQRNQPIALTEFDPNGEALLELGFIDSYQLSYRAYKFPWQGFPTTDPQLIVLESVSETVPSELRYNWNGATEVISYSVLGGETPNNLFVVAQQPKTDFEDATSLADIDGSICFFQVVPSMAGEAVARASNLVYAGDKECDTGVTASFTETASLTFTHEQNTGNITGTLQVGAGDYATSTILIHTPVATVASIPDGQVVSDVRFSISVFEGVALSETTDITGNVQLSLDYGALDLSRNPDDVNLLRWDDATQSWSSDGLTLLAREIVGQRVTYALHTAGTFALFITNEAPQSAPVQVTIDEDEQITFASGQFPYFDVDGDDFAALLIESVPLSGSLAFSGTPVVPSQVITVGAISQLAFTPAADEFGLPYASFDYAVSDGFTQSVTNTLTILVRPVNDEPVAVDDNVLFVTAAATDADESFTLSIAVLENDFDVDGDDLQIVDIGEPEHGSAVQSGALIVYTSAQSYSGSDSFSYTIDDGNGGQATATVLIQRSPYIRYLPSIGNE